MNAFTAAAPWPIEPLPPHRSARSIRAEAAEALLPPKRYTVAEAAERYRRLNNAPTYVGPWRNEKTPYMVGPMEAITARDREAVIFVGPAQSGKTDALIVNAIAHAVTCDPMDMMVVQTSQAEARDFSRRRVDRLNRDSEAVGSRSIARRDNVHDKEYAGGMILSLGWPAISQLSGKPIPRMLLTDYDRMPADVDGEGEPFDLAAKRTTTFGSLGLTLAESSPGRPIIEPGWECPPGSHLAPPVAGGILALYNRGDRQRWHWPCPHCGETFEGSFKLLDWPKGAPPEMAAAATRMVCPRNGCIIEPGERDGMNARGRWVAEDPGAASRVASYWLKGTAAAWVTWPQLVYRYVTALEAFERSGDENALRTTINVDQGEPYLPAALAAESALDPAVLAARAEDFPLGRVPAGAGFLTASIDVQGNRFEAQVVAWGAAGERWVIAHEEIFEAPGGGRMVQPASFDEDWDLLFAAVLERAWPLADDPARGMMPRFTVCDMQGEPGVTTRALDFARRVKARGLGPRFRLLRGASSANAPRLAETYPDSRRKDRHAGARGEIPVLQLHPWLLKDEVFTALGRTVPGTEFVHLPAALRDPEPPHHWFDQLAAEVRKPDGWHRRRNRNEAWDLLVYNRAAWLFLKADKMDWETRPAFARREADNPFLVALGPNGEQPDRTASAAEKQPFFMRLAH
ncbi:phage terminase large subunit family protein [Oceanibacterium hippocampi]|uniref:Phage terminase large subunit (GpA) n=1 Tax=Oceanibacterium hippocampi TaxID=745714 RepID=A0A1Y5U0V6_9PROT|nr:terminase gpA endonuclease subunit [Oceanibacterium hippocampi]SLN77577.1 Phage terminase large subunit (GpA) [Oceanibacterium hippocampi]